MNNIDRFFSSNFKTYAESYLNYLKDILDKINLEEVDNFVNILNEARNQEASVFFIGNGGSAATASHFANDIAIGTNDYVLPYKAVSLTDNNAIITAIGNDHGYDQIFIRQLKIFGKPNDVLVGISASGNSQNIINAFNYATEIEMHTIAITAFDGGKMKDISKNNIHIPTEINEYGPAEDVHMILDHLVSNYLMRFVKSD